jgi:hypothetical protein
MTRGLFTWSNNHKNPTLEKLDRVLASVKILENFIPFVYGS